MRSSLSASPFSAETDTGTSCIDSSRFVAVTVISSIDRFAG
jgi:hypothetical protein